MKNKEDRVFQILDMKNKLSAFREKVVNAARSVESMVNFVILHGPKSETIQKVKINYYYYYYYYYMDWLWKGPWGLKKSIGALLIGGLLVAALSIFMGIDQKGNLSIIDHSSFCQFPAIYNFGDSNSDTGSISAIYGPVAVPNGNTFFGIPSGRYSDGRLVIDFIAEMLGLPYLNAYLDSIGTSFQNGGNFAAAGSTVQPAEAKMLQGGRPNPLALNIQLRQFQQFKARTTYLHKQGKNSLDNKIGLPRPEDFSKALYTIDSGQNDLDSGIRTMKEEEVLTYIPNIIDELASAIKKLHQLGARVFWVHNTGPIGCLPFYVINYPQEASNADPNGCVISFNNLAQEFNNQLKDKVSKLRTQLEDVFITYVDIYSAKYTLISEAKKHGFTSHFEYCCGDFPMVCGRSVVVNGTEFFGDSCNNPQEFISWDSVHYTEAANIWVANHILDGSFSDPPVPITEACHKPI